MFHHFLHLRRERSAAPLKDDIVYSMYLHNISIYIRNKGDKYKILNHYSYTGNVHTLSLESDLSLFLRDND